MTFSNLMLYMKASDCINSCSAEELSEMLQEITKDPICYYGNHFSSDPVLFINICNMLTVYAYRYPEQFCNDTLPCGTESILISAIQNAVFNNHPAAFTLLRKAIMHNLHNKCTAIFCDFKDIISVAALKHRTDCLSYCADNIDNISTLISPELLFYLFDNNMTDAADILLTGRSKEDIADVFIEKGAIYYFDSSNFSRTIAEYIYETCIRYIPGIRDSDNVPAAVSGFIDFIDRKTSALSILKSHIFTFSCSPDDIKAELSAMKRLGLCFSDITEFVLLLNRCSFNNFDRFKEIDIQNIFKEYFLPVIGDTVFFRPFYCINNVLMDSDMKNYLFSLFDLIGKERIRFDIRDEALNLSQNIIDEYFSSNQKHTPQIFRRFFNSGIKFITDEDLTRGCAADIITLIPPLLNAMLRQNTFSSDQIRALICKASSERRAEALNIINKYIIISRN